MGGRTGLLTESTAREAAQQAWRDAMSIWQQAELMQVGPAGGMGMVTAGETLRDRICSLTMVNTCRVDQELVAENFGSPSFFDTALVNVMGLDALEYLLFHVTEDNTCPPQATINTSSQWVQFGADERRRSTGGVRRMRTQLPRKFAPSRMTW